MGISATSLSSQLLASAAMTLVLPHVSVLLIVRMTVRTMRSITHQHHDCTSSGSSPTFCVSTFVSDLTSSTLSCVSLHDQVRFPDNSCPLKQ